jgi:hypothetical protein
LIVELILKARVFHVFDDDFVLPGLFFRATFLPFLRASERPIAIACFLLVTFFPLLPLLSVPLLRRRITDSTSFEALFEVFRFDVLRAAMSYISDAKAGRADQV